MSEHKFEVGNRVLYGVHKLKYRVTALLECGYLIRPKDARVADDSIIAYMNDLTLIEEATEDKPAYPAMPTLESAIQEARRQLDMFNLEVAKVRVEKGMSDAFKFLYKNMGRLDKELVECLTWAGYLDAALKEMKKGETNV